MYDQALSLPMDGRSVVQAAEAMDNVEHFPDLPNFPHHVHVGEESRVEPGRLLSIIALIEVIEQELG